MLLLMPNIIILLGAILLVALVLKGLRNLFLVGAALVVLAVVHLSSFTTNPRGASIALPDGTVMVASVRPGAVSREVGKARAFARAHGVL
jgi:hypothetical protein